MDAIDISLTHPSTSALLWRRGKYFFQFLKSTVGLRPKDPLAYITSVTLSAYKPEKWAWARKLPIAHEAGINFTNFHSLKLVYLVFGQATLSELVLPPHLEDLILKNLTISNALHLPVTLIHARFTSVCFDKGLRWNDRPAHLKTLHLLLCQKVSELDQLLCSQLEDLHIELSEFPEYSVNNLTLSKLRVLDLAEFNHGQSLIDHHMWTSLQWAGFAWFVLPSDRVYAWVKLHELNIWLCGLDRLPDFRHMLRLVYLRIHDPTMQHLNQEHLPPFVRHLRLQATSIERLDLSETKHLRTLDLRASRKLNVDFLRIPTGLDAFAAVGCLWRSLPVSLDIEGIPHLHLQGNPLQLSTHQERDTVHRKQTAYTQPWKFELVTYSENYVHQE